MVSIGARKMLRGTSNKSKSMAWVRMFVYTDRLSMCLEPRMEYRMHYHRHIRGLPVRRWCAIESNMTAL